MTFFHFWVNFVFCFPHRNVECVRVLPLDIQPLFWMRSEHPADSSSRLRRPVYYHFPVWLGCYSDIPPVTHPRAGDVWARQSGTHIIQVFLPLKKITCVLKSVCGDHFKVFLWSVPSSKPQMWKLQHFVSSFDVHPRLVLKSTFFIDVFNLSVKVCVHRGGKHHRIRCGVAFVPPPARYTRRFCLSESGLGWCSHIQSELLRMF